MKGTKGKRGAAIAVIAAGVIAAAPTASTADVKIAPMKALSKTMVPPASAPPVYTTTVPASSGTCTEVRLPVAFSAGQPKNAIIAGTLCVPVNWAAGPRTIDVLVHGGMYNRQYWDWPIRPETYSYARRTVQAGRATFFYDRYGAGLSTRPPGPQASFPNDVHGLHQVISWLRGT